MRKPVFGAVTLLAGGLMAGQLLSSPARAATSPATESTAKTSQTAAAKAMLGHVNAHLAALKKTLAITPAEQTPWHGFAEVMRGNATSLSAMYQARTTQIGTMNAVANMESYAAITAKQADDINELTAAFQTLYTALSPAQQQKADAIFRMEAKRHAAKHKP